MKTVLAVIEKSFVCAVPVSIPDWWDNATARERLGARKALLALEEVADPCEWEESDEEPSVRCVCGGGVAGTVAPLLVFSDDGAPAFLENRWMPS